MAKKQEKGKPGRPSIWTQDLASRICTRLAKGESLRSICEDADMPNRDTVADWVIKNHNGFSVHYEEARNVGLDTMADEVLKIADEQVGSTETGMTDSGAVSRNRLRMDARRWYLSKMAPKRYGDRLDVEAKHSGTIGLSLNIHDTPDPDGEG